MTRWFLALWAQLFLLAVTLPAVAAPLGRGQFQVMRVDRSAAEDVLVVRVGEDLPVRVLVSLANASRDPGQPAVTPEDIAARNSGRVRFACASTPRTPVTRGMTRAHWDLCAPGARQYVSIVDHMTLRIPRQHVETDAERLAAGAAQQAQTERVSAQALREVEGRLAAVTNRAELAEQALKNTIRVHSPTPQNRPQTVTPTTPWMRWGITAIVVLAAFAAGVATRARRRPVIRFRTRSNRGKRARNRLARRFLERCQRYDVELQDALQQAREEMAASQGRITEQHCKEREELQQDVDAERSRAASFLDEKLGHLEVRKRQAARIVELEEQVADLHAEIAEERGDRSEVLERAQRGDVAVPKLEKLEAEHTRREALRAALMETWQQYEAATQALRAGADVMGALEKLRTEQGTASQIRDQLAINIATENDKRTQCQETVQRLSEQCLAQLAAYTGLPVAMGEVLMQVARMREEGMDQTIAARADQAAYQAARTAFIDEMKRMRKELADLHTREDSWASLERDGMGAAMLAQMREDTVESHVRMLMAAMYRLLRKLRPGQRLSLTAPQYSDLFELMDRETDCPMCGVQHPLTATVAHLRQEHGEQLLRERKNTLPPPGTGSSQKR